MSMPRLNVLWQNNRLVGRVIETSATDFVYSPDWIKNGFDLSPLVVVFGDRAHRNQSEAFDFLPGFLSDCLPDQWGRRILMHDFPHAPHTPKPIEMLAWVGWRGIGALSFDPAMVENDPSRHWIEISAALLTREAQALLQDQPSTAFPHLRQVGIAGGSFPKATVALTKEGRLLVGGNVASKALIDADARLGILKLDCEDNPRMPSTDGRMEHAYLLMAKAAGIRTANSEVLTESASGKDRCRHHLFIERFDVIAGNPLRLHMISLAGLLESFDLRYSHLLETTIRITANRQDLLEAVKRMIFNMRAANTDDHGKNHAFLFDPRKAGWALSPAYDLTLNYSIENRCHGLLATTFGASPQRSSMVELALEFAILENEFDEIDAQVVEAIHRWPENSPVRQVYRQSRK